MVRVLEMILHSSGMNNSCTFYKIFEGNDHYLSLTSNTNKFIRFVLLVQKKKKKEKGRKKKIKRNSRNKLACEIPTKRFRDGP